MFSVLVSHLTQRALRSKLLRLILVLLASSLLAGCTFVRVVNNTTSTNTVLISVPDNAWGYTRRVRSGGSTEVFSSHGGRYVVSLLPDKEYIQLLESIRAIITKRLFQEGASLTPAEVAQLVNRLEDIEQQIEQELAVQATCSGSVPDFETVVVTLSGDSASGTWQLSCP